MVSRVLYTDFASVTAVRRWRVLPRRRICTATSASRMPPSAAGMRVGTGVSGVSAWVFAISPSSFSERPRMDWRSMPRSCSKASLTAVISSVSMRDSSRPTGLALNMRSKLPAVSSACVGSGFGAASGASRETANSRCGRMEISSSVAAAAARGRMYAARAVGSRAVTGHVCSMPWRRNATTSARASTMRNRRRICVCRSVPPLSWVRDVFRIGYAAKRTIPN